MGQKVIQHCDTMRHFGDDGELDDPVTPVGTVHIDLPDGSYVDAEMCEECADAFLEQVSETFGDGAIKVKPAPRQRKHAAPQGRRNRDPNAPAIRAWAAQASIPVPEKGRMPDAVRKQWEAAGAPGKVA